MSNNKTVEYIIRIGSSDRYRHLHISEKGKIVLFTDALTFAENDLKLNWEYYKMQFLEGKDE